MNNYCFNCMKGFTGDFCPNCGFKAGEKQLSPMLAFKTVLNRRYTVGKCIRKDGDSFTYIALDSQSGKCVQVTEFFVHNIMSRASDGLRIMFRPDKTDFIAELSDDFTDMAGKLKKLSADDNSISVSDIFSENNTIYYVSLTDERMSLTDVVDAFRKSGSANWDKLLPLFDMLISELEMLHLSGLVHRGIDDKTVQLSSDGNIRLTGFSIASARIEGKGLDVCLSHDYAAPEQFAGTPYPDRTSDIYSVCALIFRCVTGKLYDSSKMSIPSVYFSEDVPVYAVNAILKGLDPDPEQRYGSMMELRAALNGEHPVSASGGRNADGSEKSGRSTKVGFVVGMSAAAAAILVGIVFAALYFVFGINIFKLGSAVSATSSAQQISGISQASSVVQTIDKVPNLIGLDIDTVNEAWGNNDKFTLKITMSSSFNSVYPRNCVMEQSPSAGTPSPGLTTIVLTVSRGPENVVVPSLLGRPLDEVYKELTKLGLKVYLVEVDETYSAVLTGKGSGLTYKTGIVLDSPTAAGEIVKAESSIALYGSVDRTPTGSYTSVTANADGTATAVVIPEPYTISGTVSVVSYSDGSKSYYLVGSSYAVSYTTSYTYDENGAITSKAQIFDTTPSGGTVSDTYDSATDTITRIYTPAGVLISGTVTVHKSSSGKVTYTVQPNPVTVSGTVSTATYSNGSTSQVFVPGSAPGSEIPLATVTSSTDPLTGKTTYTIIPK